MQELYDEFVVFCKNEQRTPFKKIEFGSKLKELGIEYYKTNGNNKYKVSIEFLDELAKTRHWIHDIDDYCEDETKTVPTETLQDDELLRKYIQSEKELNELKLDYEKMRLELDALKKEQKPKTAVRFIDSDSEDEVVKPAPKKKSEKKSKMQLAIDTKLTDSD